MKKYIPHIVAAAVLLVGAILWSSLIMSIDYTRINATNTGKKSAAAQQEQQQRQEEPREQQPEQKD